MFLTLFSLITSILTCCVLWQITWNNADIIKVFSKTLQKLPYLVNLKNDISIICAKTSYKNIMSLFPMFQIMFHVKTQVDASCMFQENTWENIFHLIFQCFQPKLTDKLCISLSDVIFHVQIRTIGHCLQCLLNSIQPCLFMIPNTDILYSALISCMVFDASKLFFWLRLTNCDLSNCQLSLSLLSSRLSQCIKHLLATL